MHVVVIGAYGSAGVAAAERLSNHVGDEVDRLTLVDGGEPGGGLCILRGCMPSKEVLSAAGHRYQVRHDDRLRGDPPDLDLERVVATKDRHVNDFAEHRRGAVHSMAEAEGVEFVHGHARFVGPRRLRLRPNAAADGGVPAGETGSESETGGTASAAPAAGEERTVEPDYVVVATGSTVNVPDLPGLDGVDYYTSADVLDATELPDSGVVMGFGYVGVEMVPYLVEAGVEDLTVIEHDERPLDEADPAFGDDLLSIYREEFGVEILTEAYEKRVEPTEEGVRLHVERESEDAPEATRGSDPAGSDGGPPPTEPIDAEALFLFTGRRPALDGLGLEEAGVGTDREWVEDTMRTRDDDRVYAVGDVNGKDPVLHVAKEEGYVAADNVLADAEGRDPTVYDHIHHHVMFSGAGVYPFTRVGHSRRSAEAADLDYVAVAREAATDGVFRTKAVPRGRASLVVDATDGTVLGYQGLHYHADVMAKTMQVAVEEGLSVHDLPDRAYHPTTPEILDGLIRAARDELTAE